MKKTIPEFYVFGEGRRAGSGRDGGKCRGKEGNRRPAVATREDIAEKKEDLLN